MCCEGVLAYALEMSEGADLRILMQRWAGGQDPSEGRRRDLKIKAYRRMVDA